MLSRTEVERLAAMANALRPDWPVRSLCTLIAADHQHRAYRDVAVALAWIATDTATVTPKRMSEAGPWWIATRAAGSDATDHRFVRCPEPGHGSFPASNCSACRSEDLEGTHPRSLEPTPAPVRDTYRRGAAAARAVLGTTTTTEVQG